MAKSIKIAIGKQAAVKMELSGFKDCGKETKKLLASAGVDATKTELKDEAETVHVESRNKVRVKA